MIRSRITVVPDLASYGPSPSDQTAQAGAQGDRLSSLLGRGGGSNSAGAAGGHVPVDVIGMPIVRKGIQVITIKVTAGATLPPPSCCKRG